MVWGWVMARRSVSREYLLSVNIAAWMGGSGIERRWSNAIWWAMSSARLMVSLSAAWEVGCARVDDDVAEMKAAEPVPVLVRRPSVYIV